MSYKSSASVFRLGIPFTCIPSICFAESISVTRARKPTRARVTTQLGRSVSGQRHWQSARAAKEIVWCKAPATKIQRRQTGAGVVRPLYYQQVLPKGIYELRNEDGTELKTSFNSLRLKIYHHPVQSHPTTNTYAEMPLKSGANEEDKNTSTEPSLLKLISLRKIVIPS